MLNGGIRKEIQKERFAKADPKGEHCKSCLLQLKIFAIVKSQDTLPTTDVLSGKNARAWVSMDFT